ncbi:MAG: chorismate--pyruvate lyase [Faecalicatena sp.]|uniref:chorismate--pyruvate lyase n=1 Tax=Faecalicatena sp. TaxID=2005360 RepID=UPI002584D01A|nr:chorismate--pyruvate lyase [Faecalicatena sp.]MCI6467510.1 chorismate--pyruvate lyase [Faecalicatena sp.]MDY5619686.1 chorismate--pyruvate lyase [Lachnospiraceae bacterium]
MLTCTYIVEKIDGDYAMLRRTDETDPNAEAKMVARALLPPEINEGSRLLYEYLQYSIIE